MTRGRLRALLGELLETAEMTRSFVEALSKPAFLEDVRTQRAVAMNLLIIGELATKLIRDFPDLTAAHPEISWRNMVGMRNRIAHGYSGIDMRIVWETVVEALPELTGSLPRIFDEINSGSGPTDPTPESDDR